MKKIPTYDIFDFNKRYNIVEKRKDFVFVETNSYRTLSREPYRTETFGIGFHRRGGMQLKAGLLVHEIDRPSIITMGPSVIRAWAHNDEDPFSTLLFFSESFFLQNQIDVFTLRSFDFFDNNDRHVLPLDDSTYMKMEAIFDQIRDTMQSDNPNEGTIIRNYITILINEIDAMHRKMKVATDAATGLENTLVKKFKCLLAARFRENRTVSFYASELHLTPKHFSAAIKEQTGKTAGEWIDEMVILEAKVLLQNKELTVSQVADHLNFTDQSAFGKFFKAVTNLSPMEYRKGLGR